MSDAAMPRQIETTTRMAKETDQRAPNTEKTRQNKNGFAALI